uniref:TFIIS N-terminal domain-containing protein n=1 Tax=Pyramimonas obovata TaxID=1411642 RepID=A0A7S0N022_9CHLO|mmetsp:Transcript_15839/g.34345  ORF Transcript_15839/g.34345 Transcript_15839/m.34345 type:complete len:431 (+) Transcript_15839:279-1571(+)|eukprot:CAMPEP_0118934114 /NCGR_PEP_ID=MMETSP1169-20130426/13645_1 /TAXON_ID=36882 /ORGANISM="Pyramimonas obovata, Strain CCMP722" /LENGTH=430 /DNA_ID=CAMNT_0006876985 /DNA_START=242 /DNA_END=1534 /DNA_ORIENTATION=-
MSDGEEEAWEQGAEEEVGKEDEDSGDEDVQASRKELAKKIFGDSDEEGSEDEQAELSKKKKKKEKKKKEGKGEKGVASRSARTTSAFEGLGGAGSDDEDNFIDDRGVALDDRDTRDDDADSVDADEAEEDTGEFDSMFEPKSGRRKKSNLSDGEIKSFVEAFLGKMDLAVDQDAEANAKGMPAIHKLSMLREVEEVLEKTHLHENLLEAGLLNILKQWLEPLGDGSIPNENVRTTLLRLLKKLPVNVEMFDRREQLKKSGLGKMIMFYYKLPEETLANKRCAQWLVEKWSRPIFELSTRYEELRRMEDETGEEADAEKERRKGKKRAGGEAFGEGELDRAEAGPKPGETGYRYHATVPMPSDMDYVYRPKQTALVDGPVKSRNVTGAGDGSKKAKIQQRLLKLKQAGRKKDVHAMKVSIQGRGVAHGIVQ